MASVPILDFAFLAFESEASPKHVAGLQIFDLPRDAPADYVDNLVASIKQVPPEHPFNQRLDSSYVRMPQWTDAEDFDVEEHVFLERVAAPGSLDALLERVAELHADRLDRDRPLWQLYFFEQIRPRGFAVYFKVHHAYMDGISLSKRALEVLTDAPSKLQPGVFWGAPSKHHARTRRKISDALFGTARKVGRAALVVPALAKLGLKHTLRVMHVSGRELPVPFTAPRTVFNAPLTAARSVAVTDFSLARVHDVAQHAGVTVNDVLLELCDSAMTAYLEERGEQLEHPLVAQMPISLRHGDGGQGNQIAIALLELGSDESNAIKRLQRIHAHAQDAKDEYVGMPEEAAEIYTLLLQSVAQFGETTGLGNLLPPLGNVVVSGVIGPAQQLYLGEAPLRATYPISTIAPGLALNITIFTYHKTLHVGLVAGKEALPDLAPLVAYMHTALDDLEKIMGFRPVRKKPRARVRKQKKKARKKTRS
ncbi:MAG: wax ester/triacylglycerol synthase family O-acyltransferase [Gammaproteobacteria bacterium]|nr:wax ester/triacylglycerol synthase family O-acyltransferase [Gammaproteobacteria bacterium]